MWEDVDVESVLAVLCIVKLQGDEEREALDLSGSGQEILRPTGRRCETVEMIFGSWLLYLEHNSFTSGQMKLSFWTGLCDLWMFSLQKYGLPEEQRLEDELLVFES